MAIVSDDYDRLVLPRASEHAEETRVVGAVHSYDTNVLSSNNPMEDSSGEALVKFRRNCMMFGVFDGHAGATCGQASC